MCRVAVECAAECACVCEWASVCSLVWFASAVLLSLPTSYFLSPYNFRHPRDTTVSASRHSLLCFYNNQCSCTFDSVHINLLTFCLGIRHIPVRVHQRRVTAFNLDFNLCLTTICSSACWHVSSWTVCVSTFSNHLFWGLDISSFVQFYTCEHTHIHFTAFGAIYLLCGMTLFCPLSSFLGAFCGRLTLVPRKRKHHLARYSIATSFSSWSCVDLVWHAFNTGNYRCRGHHLADYLGWWITWGRKGTLERERALVGQLS